LNAFYVDFNFYGWIEGELLQNPSPTFTFKIRIWDTCAAAYDFSWNDLQDVEVEIDSGVGAS